MIETMWYHARSGLPRGFVLTGSAAKRKMQRNMIAAAIRTTAISTAVHAVTTLKQPRDGHGVGA